MFTQFDKLISREDQSLTGDDLKKSEDEIDAIVLKRANDAFEGSCVKPLNMLGHKLPYAKVSSSIQFHIVCAHFI